MLVGEDKPVVYNEPALAERNVAMSNTLTQVAHSLTLAEKRLITAHIARNGSIPLVELRREGAWRVWLSTAECIEAFDVDANTTYEQLQGASDSLFNRCVCMVREIRGGSEEFKFRWVGSTEHHKSEGWVELVWLQKMVSHLFSLRQEFTTYKLRQAAALRSIYAWRLFRCFKSWAATGRYTPAVEEFHRAMDASESQRKNFKDLRRRVIEPAVKGLQEKNGLHIEWGPETVDHKVVKLGFRFRVSPQGALF